MSKIFLSEVPCSDQYLTDLGSLFPEIDSFSFYTYLTMRKIASDLENTLEGYFSAYGVSSGRFMLLLLLATNPKGMMPSELAQECGVTQATISGLLNGLEKASLIVRETHSHDGRAYVIKLSDKGLGLLNRVKPEFFGCLNNMLGEFKIEEKRILVDHLARFGGCLKHMTNLKLTRQPEGN